MRDVRELLAAFSVYGLRFGYRRKNRGLPSADDIVRRNLEISRAKKEHGTQEPSDGRAT